AVDHISLDLKLASDLRAPVPIEVPVVADAQPRLAPEPGAATADAPPWPADASSWRRTRRDALRLLRGRDACGKLVVTDATDPDEALEALEDVAELAAELPVFVQPATPVPGIEAPTEEALEALVEAALELDLTVRLVPQVHALTGRR
ncbi:MAG: hypothetical protein AAFZ65_16240, partial [Planctomycetota bacterium]